MKQVLYKIKEGKLEQLKSWFLELEKRKEEVIATLEHEKVMLETMSLFEIDGQWYLFGLMLGECLPADLSVELNQKHREIMKDSLEPVCIPEKGYFFQR